MSTLINHTLNYLYAKFYAAKKDVEKHCFFEVEEVIFPAVYDRIMLIHVKRWFSNPDIILIFTVISIFMREILNDSGGNNVPKNCSFQKPSRNRIGPMAPVHKDRAQLIELKNYDEVSTSQDGYF